ncbi:hypothetical protein EVAR_41112_1 [Eumeta japonica]|uniref:Uncharacterized protein n=1 Tax=Eumeta variegata TaxID=151549 RepID=A0A4C1XC45_EUMVA|nr:hypothetical protein EVAR_41112_1 [Eumeta japonica]
MDTPNLRGVTNALLAFWKGIEYLMEGDWDDGERVGEVNARAVRSASLIQIFTRSPAPVAFATPRKRARFVGGNFAQLKTAPKYGPLEPAAPAASP